METSCTVLRGVLCFWEDRKGEETQVERSMGRPRSQLGLGGGRRLWSGSSGEEEPVQLTGHCGNTGEGLCPAGKAPGLRTGLGGLPGFPFSLCCLLARDLGQNAYPH